jgi:hypothetical protein
MLGESSGMLPWKILNFKALNGHLLRLLGVNKQWNKLSLVYRETELTKVDLQVLELVSYTGTPRIKTIQSRSMWLEPRLIRGRQERGVVD